MVNIGRIFCCFNSGEVSEGSKHTSSTRDSHKANKKKHATEASEMNKNSTISAAPPKNEINRPGGDISHMQLDYVNPGENPPEEDLIKGRRHSVSVIASPEYTQPSEKNDTSSREDTLDHNELPDVAEIEATPVVDEHSSAATTGFYKHTHKIELLPPISPILKGRKCLVLDLDETLVHSSFKEIWNADFVIAVEVEGTVHDVYVTKRPGVDDFLKKVSEMYEVVVFTASVSKYGDPLLDRLDPDHYIHHRLFRDSCMPAFGGYVKNLAWLGRNLNDIIIIDNSPSAYSLQPFNAVPVSSWFSDIHDNELLDMLPILEDLADPSVFDVSRHLQYEW